MTKVNYQIWSKTFVNNRRKSRDQGMQGNQLSLTSHDSCKLITYVTVEWISVGKASAYAFQYVIKPVA